MLILCITKTMFLQIKYSFLYSYINTFIQVRRSSYVKNLTSLFWTILVNVYFYGTARIIINRLLAYMGQTKGPIWDIFIMGPVVVCKQLQKHAPLKLLVKLMKPNLSINYFKKKSYVPWKYQYYWKMHLYFSHVSNSWKIFMKLILWIHISNLSVQFENQLVFLLKSCAS